VELPQKYHGCCPFQAWHQRNEDCQDVGWEMSVNHRVHEANPGRYPPAVTACSITEVLVPIVQVARVEGRSHPDDRDDAPDMTFAVNSRPPKNDVETANRCWK